MAAVTSRENALKLKIFGYSSGTQLQSFPPVATSLRGFRDRVYRGRKVIKFWEFELRLNCRQHLLFHQDTISLRLTK